MADYREPTASKKQKEQKKETMVMLQLEAQGGEKACPGCTENE